MHLRTIPAHASLWFLYVLSAFQRPYLRPSASQQSNFHPVPVFWKGSYCITESFNPPVACTTGTVPYLCAYICGRPQGSYLEGMRMISAAAMILCSSSEVKPTKPATLPLLWFSASLRNLAYFSSPVPIMTTCTYPVTPAWSPFMSQGKIDSITSIPFWYARRPMKATMGMLGSSLSPMQFCRWSLQDRLPVVSSLLKKLSYPWHLAERKRSVSGFHSSQSMPLRTPSRCGKRPLHVSCSPHPPSTVMISSL
mmetsp:Transcript_40309/g.126889  ORF Transcript_40309/g.126889 Transcript_40309/m.126889 type:complete len:252 (+) Transcript_40309:123-878(+)